MNFVRCKALRKVFKAPCICLFYKQSYECLPYSVRTCLVTDVMIAFNPTMNVNIYYTPAERYKMYICFIIDHYGQLSDSPETIQILTEIIQETIKYLL